MKKDFFYRYIFLAALYPVLFMYQENIYEVHFSAVFLPFVFYLTVTLVIWIVLSVLIDNRDKRALIALLLSLTVFHFKQVFDVLEEYIALFAAEAAFYVYLGIVILGLLFPIYRIRVSKKRYRSASRVLFGVFSFLLLWNLAVAGIKQYTFNRELAGDTLSENGDFIEPTFIHGRPDIYHIILDEFASIRSAQELLGYDNGSFSIQLHELGFQPENESESAYAMTQLAIASVLNMSDIPSTKNAIAMIRKNKVTDFLASVGYQIIDFPVDGLTNINNSSKSYIFSQRSGSVFINAFYEKLATMSVFYRLYENMRAKDEAYLNYSREETLFKLNTVPTLAADPGPKYVFVHLMCPHVPFVFGENGEKIPSIHHNDFSDKRYYLGQYRFISAEIVKMVTKILRNSEKEPIIIVQSDHGYRGSQRKTFGDVIPEEAKKRIFLGLFLPEGIQAPDAGFRTSTEIFPFILDTFFGQKLFGKSDLRICLVSNS